MPLELLPISLTEANAFVQQHHRHHCPVVGHKFSLAAARDGETVGVAIVGRPVSRRRDDGQTLEVTRLCTDGTRNCCCFLYGAAARAAFALGYRRIGIYTLPNESGASLRATPPKSRVPKLTAPQPPPRHLRRNGSPATIPSRPNANSPPIPSGSPAITWPAYTCGRAA